MEFRIADTFTDSLAKLSGDEQKAVKTTAFDMQMDPSRPGLQFHRLDRARDKNFWSVRVSSDVRIIVHRTQNSLLLCYVDHHDPAYRWARQRRLETHPRTGAAQLVEVRETVKEIEVPVYVQVEKPRPLPFANITDEELLNYGVPAEWLPDVRTADDNTLLDLADHLPVEAAEALLELATGGTPPLPSHTVPQTDPFEHPDARRRFRVMHDVEELERALDYPWEKWVVFLHPTQRELVERTYNGPARVSGSAGTGKTIVALPPRRSSCAHQSRCPRPADDIFRDTGQRPAQQAARPDQLAAAPRRTHRGLRHRRLGRKALPPQPGRVHACIIRTNRRTDRRGGCRVR